MRARLGGVVLVAVLAFAPTADAAQRYAAPGGSGTACGKQSPCSLAEAITKAGSNDEVIVGAGTYSVSTPLFPPAEAANVYIHGDLSGQMPKIVGMTKGVPIGTGNATRLSYLDISNSGAFEALAAICNPGSLIERVRVLAVGEAATGLTIRQDCTTRDSLVRAEGLASTAVFAFGFPPSGRTGIAVNLTAIATGPQSIGALTNYTDELNPGTYTLDLKNSIISGEGADLLATSTIGGPGNIVVTNSNFDAAKPEGSATITGGPNQTAPPLFVDAANGDYREAAGSPTIDAGSTDQIGSLDLEGNPRSQGAAPDIGAFEFVPAAAPVAAIEALALAPRRFRAVSAGSAIISRGAKKGAPLGTRVTYTLSVPARVSFSVERAIAGRRVGKKCRKRTRANRRHKRCVLYRPRKGGFKHGGAQGRNSFRFSGRMNGRALRPGRYRLVGSVGASSKRAAFTIVR